MTTVSRNIKGNGSLVSLFLILLVIKKMYLKYLRVGINLKNITKMGTNNSFFKRKILPGPNFIYLKLFTYGKEFSMAFLNVNFTAGVSLLSS
jgi:hypothetical protein